MTDERSGSDPASVDEVVAGVLARYGCRFALAESDEDRAHAFRLRRDAVVERGWSERVAADDVEYDEFDERAVLIVGWDGDRPVATGRLVFPPGLLPTEAATGILVEPVGQVVDVGRMVVASPFRTPRAGVFVALLSRLYGEVRARGFTVACGMMSPTARALVRHLGVGLEVLGEDRLYWGEERAPVRFEVDANAASLTARWSLG
jgi:hypothetical protein